MHAEFSTRRVALCMWDSCWMLRDLATNLAKQSHTIRAEALSVRGNITPAMSNPALSSCPHHLRSSKAGRRSGGRVIRSHLSQLPSSTLPHLWALTNLTLGALSNVWTAFLTFGSLQDLAVRPTPGAIDSNLVQAHHSMGLGPVDLTWKSSRLSENVTEV